MYMYACVYVYGTRLQLRLHLLVHVKLYVPHVDACPCCTVKFTCYIYVVRLRCTCYVCVPFYIYVLRSAFTFSVLGSVFTFHECMYDDAVHLRCTCTCYVYICVVCVDFTLYLYVCCIYYVYVCGLRDPCHVYVCTCMLTSQLSLYVIGLRRKVVSACCVYVYAYVWVLRGMCYVVHVACYAPHAT